MSRLVPEEEKKKEKPKKRRKRASGQSRLSRTMASVLNGDFFQRENLIRNMPFFLFVAVLLIVYIGYGYYVDKTSRNIAELEEESRSLQADINNEKAYYGRLSMYSQIADSTSVDGVGPSLDPPIKIPVPKQMFDVSK